MSEPSPLALHLRYLERRNLRPGTIRQRQYVLLKFSRDAGVDLLAATFDHLERHLDRAGIGIEARATETSHLKQFYKWARTEGLVDEDPTERLVRPRVPRRLPRPIATDDLVRALDGAPERVRPWLYLAAYTGMRASEIGRLRREEVLEDNEPPVLLVVDGKGGKQRVMPMPDELVAEFRRWPVPVRGPMFTKRDGTLNVACPGWLISQLSNEYLHSIGIGATLHTLRHWYGTTVYRRSSDLRLTQELMGHSSPVTTAGYAAWSPKEGAAAVKGLTVAHRAAG